jgi:hypothetical protein
LRPIGLCWATAAVRGMALPWTVLALRADLFFD